MAIGTNAFPVSISSRQCGIVWLVSINHTLFNCMSRPFFIVGASRSGTTMMRLILNSHSCIAVPDEMKYFNYLNFSNNIDSWRSDFDESRYSKIISSYLKNNSHLFSDSIDDLHSVILADSDRTLRGPYRSLLEYYARSHGKERWGEKTPGNIFYIDVISDMFPDALFIHIVRDPRAVVQSMNSIDYYSDETAFNALNWRKAIRDGEQLLQDCVPTDRQLTIRYEDLVLHSESTVVSVCEFLGESFEPEMLQFYQTADRYMANKIRTPSIKEPVNQKSLTKWKERLTPSEIALIEAICSDEMDRLGYDRQTTDSYSFDHVAVAPKMLYWHWKVWQHRHHRGYEVDYSFLAGIRTRAGQWGDSVGLMN